MKTSKKTILYRLFKMGKIPKALRPGLESEGMLVCDEGIGGWIIMKDFRAPGKRSKYRMTGFSGFLAITRKRIIAYAYGRRMINVAFEDARIYALNVKLVNPNRIECAFESSTFHRDWSGRITVRFNTPKAAEFLGVFNKMVAEQKG
jgi:hypothetical protein